MKKLSVLLIVIALASCKSSESNNGAQTDGSVESEIIIQERIDGPANVREEPSGELIFELFDNVMVDASELNKGWHKLIIYMELDKNKFAANEIVSIPSGTPIVNEGDTIGAIKTSIEAMPFEAGGGKYLLVELVGYTHKDNIKQHSIIERVIDKELNEKNRSLKDWAGFIEKFDLDDRNLNIQENIKTFENADGSAQMGPSPGPRVILLFEDNKLIGLFHSRDINVENTETYELSRYGSVTFFADYPKEKRTQLIDSFNVWLFTFN